MTDQAADPTARAAERGSAGTAGTSGTSGTIGTPGRPGTAGAIGSPGRAAEDGGDDGDGGIVLGPTQYGKSEIRLVHITRDTPRHAIRDLTVTTTLRGTFTDSYVTGDQDGQLPTDSQKNTVFGYARRYGIGAIEDFGLRLARHFVDDIAANTAARVQIAEHGWGRIDAAGGASGTAVGAGGSSDASTGDGAGGAGRTDASTGDGAGGAGQTDAGAGHDHSFVATGPGVRTASVAVDGSGDGRRTSVVAGVRDLVLLKSTGSEYRGYLKDPYTTLAETTDRILATSLVARWRYAQAAVDGATDPGGTDWDGMYQAAYRTLLATFATLHSKALQHSLWHMGRAVLAEQPLITAVHLAAPNKHHFLVDLEPFGQDNPGQVFYAADRPYGMIEAVVTREGTPGPSFDWPDGA